VSLFSRSALEFKLSYGHLDELQGLASLAGYLYEDYLAIVANDRADGASGPAVNRIAKPHDRVL
jgi:hypothetical protein